MSNLSLYGTISMSLIIGLLLGLIVLALLDRGDATEADISPFAHDARADQLRRSAVLGTDEQPLVTRMDLPPRGRGITLDTHLPTGRHRRPFGAMSATTGQRPSFAQMGLEEALAWLAVDRINRETQRAQFRELIGAYAH